MRADELQHQLIHALTLAISEEEKREMTLWLMEEKLGLSRTAILTGREVNGSLTEFDDALHRLNQEEPLQYILGKAAFYGRTFEVNPSVLIPRPETELLVQHVIEVVGKSAKGTLLDIGTGSGCIAVSLALELPGFKVLATDVSPKALDVARRNASFHRAEVQFYQDDILTDNLQTHLLDVVVSNPPYILKSETLRRNVVDHEPGLALFVSDDDPLLFHRTIAEKAKKLMKKGGLLIMEINENLGAASAGVLVKSGYTDVRILKDLDSKYRFVSGRSQV